MSCSPSSSCAGLACCTHPGRRPSCRAWGPTEQDPESGWSTPWRPWRSECVHLPPRLRSEVGPVVHCVTPGAPLCGGPRDRGPLEVCSAQPALPAANSAPHSPPPPLPLPWASLPRTDLHSHSSMAQRSDFLELDCQLTRDGVVVVSHDENLSRQSGVNRDVSSLNFEELPLYKEELEVYFSPGHFAHGTDRHMMSLEDVFQRFPRLPMSVEIKSVNEELINKVAGLVRHFDRSEITIWASEKSSVMRKCRAAVSPCAFAAPVALPPKSRRLQGPRLDRTPRCRLPSR
ncbi:lysophospholipase D GDPD3 isoform X2 [Neovison vison]|uniref:lysophospholipase D GDPD3 isoform X2 n=1 Tax=Neovison vison TaxID=452646 RepID=UPI001CF0BAA5|nr:lysophospholipase D GDPD3 isoform X2 [Neogale vison]